MDGQCLVNPHALQLIHQWSIAEDAELPHLCTLVDVNFVFF